MDEGLDEEPAVSQRYDEWRCTDCGHAHPKNHPPCDRCGAMSFELVEVEGEDFDDELSGPSYIDLLRENWLLTSVAAVVLLVAGVAALTSTGLFVLSDPFGLGLKYGVVETTPPDGDGQLTAAEFGGLVAEEYAVQTVRWSGSELQLRYRTSAESNAGVRSELTDVARRYAEYVASGGAGERLRITVTTGDRTVARVTVDRDLAAEFAAGRIDESTYRSRIFGTG